MFHKFRSLSDYYHYYRCYYHYHYCHCHCRYTTASLSKLVSQGQQTQWWSAPNLIFPAFTNLNIIILPRPTTGTSHARHPSATKRFLHSSETINRDQQRYTPSISFARDCFYRARTRERNSRTTRFQRPCQQETKEREGPNQKVNRTISNRSPLSANTTEPAGPCGCG